MITVPMKVATSSSGVPVVVGGTAAAIQAGVSAAYYASQNAKYDGDYSVSPTDHEQVLQTADKVMQENVVIAPIPSNYGLITYNGSTITVS